MPGLIIGHTTDRSATVWLRGDWWRRWAEVSLLDADADVGVERCRVRLKRADDFTAVAPLDAPLRPATRYQVEVRFGPTRGRSARGEPIRGHFKTFPTKDADVAPFRFLLGSCNLSTVRLSAIGGFLAGAIGMAATDRAWVGGPLAERPQAPLAPLRRLRRGGGAAVSWVHAWLFWLTFRVPRFALGSVLASPVEALGERDPAFMIHAGDQIYFDVDFPRRDPHVKVYREAYRHAWFGDEHYARLLRDCPHYMILDDHEIVDGFANDKNQKRYRDPALKAYREYVHVRNPNGADADDRSPLYYEFVHGTTPFFVLDTRSRRDVSSGAMIDAEQLAALCRWLERDREALKFVVSSVPFVAEVAEVADVADEKDREDKWCCKTFRAQRDLILEAVHAAKVRRLVFLAGDMHCTYHATMRLGPPRDRVTIHELGAGPIYQLQFARRRSFRQHVQGEVGALPYTTWMERFQGAAASVSEISVEPGPRPRLQWKVLPTQKSDPAVPGDDVGPLSGEIRFEEQLR